jgi:hypothetical protein
MVQKQVTLNAAEGKPAKLTLKARGPCSLQSIGRSWKEFVSCAETHGSAFIDETTTQKNERTCNANGESPIILVHKRVATLDTKLAEMGGDLASNPLESNLGFYDFRRHTTAPGNTAHTF